MIELNSLVLRSHMTEHLPPHYPSLKEIAWNLELAHGIGM